MRLTKAQIQRLQRLENRRGQITPHRVVEDAKRKTSPLHSLFNWSIAKAAEKWWLHQARLILGAVPVLITNTTMTYKGPNYLVDTTMPGSGYRSIATIVADPDSARDSLIYTLEVAAGHIRRAYDIAKPLGLAQEIDALLAQIVGVQRLARKKTKPV